MTLARAGLSLVGIAAIVLIFGSYGVAAAGPTGPSGSSGPTGPSGPSGPPEELPVCQEPGPIDAAELPPIVLPEECDLVGRIVQDQGTGVTVPEPGIWAGTYGTGVDGGDEFSVRTQFDGTVELIDVGDGQGDVTLPPPSVVAAIAPPSLAACEDSATNPQPYRQSDRHDWRIKTSSFPAGLDATATVTRIRNGVRNITQANNDCGLPDNISATSNYLGSTNLSANYDGLNCTSNDSVNVVDFGAENSPNIARTCWWTNVAGDELLSADTRLQASTPWTTNPGPGCSNKYDIESFMTHEFGHVFGLGHVTGSTHSELTMYPSATSCSIYWRTLGRGDWLGLDDLY